MEALIKQMNCGVPGQFHEFTGLQLITLSIIVTQQFLSRSALHISTNKPANFENSFLLNNISTALLIGTLSMHCENELLTRIVG